MDNNRRPAPIRTPAHERVVRNLRLARADLDTLVEANRLLHTTNETLTERVRISDLRGDVALEAQRSLEKTLDRITERNADLNEELAAPIPMRLPCPTCGELHVDEGLWATRPHHTHACQHCGAVWRPAVRTTVGVHFLPGGTQDQP